MTIQKEEIEATSHEFAVGCETCATDELKTVFWRRSSGYGVETEAWDVARRHDNLFDKKHDVVVYEYLPTSRLE